HAGQHSVGTGLHRQVQVFHQFRHFGVGLDQGVGEFQRVAGGIADAVDAIDGSNDADQFGQVGGAPVMGCAAIAVDVLPQQRDFAYAVLGQVDHLCQNIIEGAADFFTAGVGHHAKGAVLAAAFHDRDIG